MLKRTSTIVLALIAFCGAADAFDRKKVAPAIVPDFNQPDLSANNNRRHIGLGPGFINEDKTLWVHHPLIMLPPQPLACDIRAVLFLSQRAFF